MTSIHLETIIHASAERCFDFSRSVNVHQGSMTRSHERAVDGVVSGLMTLGDSVTWEARHLGFTRRLTSRITEYDRPVRFVDEQVSGPFVHFRHVHQFLSLDHTTRMLDDFTYDVAYGAFGAVANWLVLHRYMRNLLLRRNTFVKRMAEQGAGVH